MGYQGKVPKYVLTALNCASGFGKCYVNNSRASDWLTKNLSLFTDDNSHNLGPYRVDFDWRVQKWYVE